SEVAEESQQIRNELSRQKSESDSVVRSVEQLKINTDMEIAEKRSEAEREANDMIQNASQRAAEINQQAIEVLDDAMSRGQELSAEAEAHLRETEQQASNLMETARNNAYQLLVEARRQSELIAKKAEFYAMGSIRDAESRLAKMEKEQDELQDFLGSLKGMVSEDSVLSMIESSISEVQPGAQPEIKSKRQGFSADDYKVNEDGAIDAEIVGDDD
ncbi:MAG: hypothetical protein RL670_702, partial [Actinomycetota bacterium]